MSLQIDYNSLPTIYKINQKSIQYWQVFYSYENNSYYTEYGFCRVILNNEISITYTSCVRTKTSEVTAKNIGKSNYISKPEQLDIECKRLFKDKTKNGYCLIDDLKEALEGPEQPIQFEVAKAKKLTISLLEKQLSDQEVFYVQPKLDGVRCYIINGVALSRNNLEFPAVSKLINSLYNKTLSVILDGELYVEGRTFSEIISDVKMGNLEYIKFNLFDIFSPKHPDWSYSTRMAKSSRYLNSFVVKTQTDEVTYSHDLNLEETIKSINQDYVSQGYEGIIIRLDRMYKFNHSNYLFKYKDFLDREFEILDFEEGNGNSSGIAATAIIDVTYSPEDLSQYPFLQHIKLPVSSRATVTGTRQMRQEYLINKESYIGKLGTVQFQGYFEDTGVLRFPRLVAIRDYE